MVDLLVDFLVDLLRPKKQNQVSQQKKRTFTTSHIVQLVFFVIQTVEAPDPRCYRTKYYSTYIPVYVPILPTNTSFILQYTSVYCLLQGAIYMSTCLLHSCYFICSRDCAVSTAKFPWALYAQNPRRLSPSVFQHKAHGRVV